MSAAGGTCEFVSPNLAYSEETFALVRRIAPLVLRQSALNQVPPIAVAGSIADEFNTRQSMFRSVVDWFQDDVLLNYMPNAFIKLDVKMGINSKLLNSTKHDLGKGNIKLETAREIYMNNRGKFAQDLSDWSVLVDFIRSEEGTVQIASLVIRQGKDLLSAHLAGLPEDVLEAVLVTYYKQGPSYAQRFRTRQSGAVANAAKYIRPGEGCNVLVQRERFAAALGLRR
jgi:hypothetical protein